MAFRIVLLGIGHTNAHVVRQWSLAPLPGAQLTCVSLAAKSTYSGMLPGVLAGQYAPHEMEIDLPRLCEAAGAELILDRVIGLDPQRRELTFASQRRLAYDALVVGIGSLPALGDVQFGYGASVVSLKPMQTAVERLRERAESWRTSHGAPLHLHVVVVGAGAGGVEIAFCLPQALARWGGAARSVTLVSGGQDVLPHARPGMRRRMLGELRRAGIQVVTGQRVLRVNARNVELSDGRSLTADLVVWATGATAPQLLSDLQLPTDNFGFLRVRDTLQSVGSDQVFAVGDAASFDARPLPKAGVYAVRQGPILWENLKHLQRGEPLQPFRPQRDFLQLLNLGDGRALGHYRGLTFVGRWVWRWKDRIDRRFMRLYQAE